MKKIYLLLIPVLLMLSACTAGGDSISTITLEATDMAEYNNEKYITINEDMDELTLDGELQVLAGKFTIEVIDTANDTALWQESFDANANFIITLDDVQAGAEYRIKIHGEDVNQFKLFIKSDVKLVPDKEKPEKYSAQKTK